MSLEQIKAKLSKYRKECKPVLLCGDASIDYVELVIKIHKANGGKESSWEYFGSDKSLNTMKDMAEGVKKAIKERDYARMDEILRNCKSTSATMAFFDWRAYDCNALYKELMLKDGFRDRNEMISKMDIECLGVREHLGGTVNMFLDYEPLDNGQYWPLSLIERKGLLFIINLFCQTEEDKRIYERLAPDIKARKDNDYKTGDWLVMHTHDPSGFPVYFRKQFDEIPLDGEDRQQKSEFEEKKVEKKLSKATCLWLGAHPDDSFYAVVKGDKKEIKPLKKDTQEYDVLETLYFAKSQRASVGELIINCKIRSNIISTRKKPNLQKVITYLNDKLETAKLGRCVKWDEETKDHYYLDIDCRYAESLR